MPTRRSLIERIGAGLGFVAVGSTAGCVGSTDPGTGGPGDGGTGDGSGTDGGDGGDGTPESVPGYAGRLYDPSTLLDTSGRAFLTYDLGTLYEMRDLFPGKTAARIEEYDERIGAVEMSKLGRLTGVAGWDGRIDSGTVPVAGSAMVDGSFSPDQLVALMGKMNGTPKAAGSKAGHDLYAIQGGPDSQALAVGVSEDSVVAGGSAHADVPAKAPVTAMLDADADGGSGYYDASTTGAKLVDELGSVTTATGVETDFAPYVDDLSIGNEDATAALTGLEGIASGSSVESDSVTSSVVAVYADGETPDEATLRSALEWVATTYRKNWSADTDAVEFSVDGRTATATLEGPPGEVLRTPPVMGGNGGLRSAAFYSSAAVVLTYVLGIGSSPGPDGGPVPQVAFTFEYEKSASPSLRIVHNGGDTVTALNLSVKVDGSGSVDLKRKKEYAAGDQIVARTEGLESGDTVRVVWSPPNRDRSFVLGEFEVP